jgi:hypothetical protein
MPSPPAVTAINPTWDNDTGGANFYGTQARADASDPLSSAQYAALMDPNAAGAPVNEFLQNAYPPGSLQNPSAISTDLTVPVRSGVPLFYGKQLGEVPQTSAGSSVPSFNPMNPATLKIIVAVILGVILVYVGLQTSVKNDILRLSKAA